MELGPNGPTERQRLPWGPKLDRRQRMTLVALDAGAQRRAYGDLKGQPSEQSLQELLEISRDPVLWGVVLGGALAELELELGSMNAVIVTWARAAGADEDVAATHLAWRLAQPLAMRPHGTTGL